MPRPRFEDEHVTSVVACVASVDPTGGFHPAGDHDEIVMLGQTDGQIDNRLREQAGHR